MRIRYAEALALLLCLIASLVRASDGSGPSTLSLTDRVVIASQLYSAVQMYFGHWKGVPSLDLDKEYARYIQQIIASDSRRDFDFASIEFLASLQNGHSGFGDKWLREKFGQRVGFYAYPLDNVWVVTRSSIGTLGVGETIAAIDGEPLKRSTSGTASTSPHPMNAGAGELSLRVRTCSL